MDTLVTTAIIGTRQILSKSIILTGTPIDQFISQIESESPEWQILLTAGSFAIYKQAGLIAEPGPQIFASAASESLATAPSNALPLLTRIFVEGKYVPLRSQVIDILASQNLLIPAQLVPILLTQGNQLLSLRSQIARIVGQRGRWLSQFKDEWNWVLKFNPELPENAESIWQEGTLEQRCNILEKFRAKDPIKSIDLLENIWKQEKADVRAKLLVTFEIGLSNQDELFLEQTLNDRADKVRKIASSLLSRLKGSNLTQRMVLRAFTFMYYHNHSLVVRPPVNFGDDWERDGILFETPQKIDPENWWMKQIIARVPPENWENHFRLPAVQCIQIIQQNNHSDVILEGLIESALLYKDLNWIIPLWDWLRTTKLDGTRKQLLVSLAAFIPQDVIEKKVESMNTKHPYWAESLVLLPKPWSLSFSQKYLRMLTQHIASVTEDDPGYNALYNSIHAALLGLHPATIKDAIQPWILPPQDTFNAWRDILETFIDLLEIRQQLLTALGLESIFYN